MVPKNLKNRTKTKTFTLGNLFLLARVPKNSRAMFLGMYFDCFSAHEKGKMVSSPSSSLFFVSPHDTTGGRVFGSDGFDRELNPADSV